MNRVWGASNLHWIKDAGCTPEHSLWLSSAKNTLFTLGQCHVPVIQALGSRGRGIGRRIRSPSPACLHKNIFLSIKNQFLIVKIISHLKFSDKTQLWRQVIQTCLLTHQCQRQHKQTSDFCQSSVNLILDLMKQR